MIKGCTKRVIVVRDINSNFFEEAFFIVKPRQSIKEQEYLTEANRIVKSDLPVEYNCVSSYTLPAKKKNSQNKGVLRDFSIYFSGFGISLVLCTFIYYFL